LFFFFSLSLYSRARILYAYAGFSYSHAGFPYTHAGVLYSLARFCCALLLLACRRPVFTCARLVLARKRPLLACALLLLACSRQLAPTVATADFVRTRDGRTRSFVHAAVARLAEPSVLLAPHSYPPPQPQALSKPQIGFRGRSLECVIKFKLAIELG